MVIKITGGSIKNCGTGITAVGKQNLQIDGIEFVDNNRDMDLSVTQDSNVEIKNFSSIGAKIESISIREYRCGIDAAREQISQLSLSLSDRDFILERLQQLEANKDFSLIQKTLGEITNVVRSVPGNVVASMIATQLLKLLA